ncbi:hypothetical protein [Streptomyces canus]|uniref:hypothetical protein n=1 Tax=Streptomyces canus TaxID=58343 RepID=UPI002E2D8D7E|nr:hypothetical protein [Streptomyces canus]
MLEHVTWRMLVYAVLSLTLIRMLPVAVALLGTGLRPATLAYIGWFGPRGLASVVFGLLAVEEHLPGTHVLGGAVALTVALSVCPHGATAPLLSVRPGAARTRHGSHEWPPVCGTRSVPCSGNTCPTPIGRLPSREKGAGRWWTPGNGPDGYWRARVSTPAASPGCGR